VAPNESAAMKEFLGTLLATILAAVVLQAQGGYSNRQANSYYANHDGAGALRYATTWSAAEPNNTPGVLERSHGLNEIAGFQVQNRRSPMRYRFAQVFSMLD
jgi:hypothetical protein